MDRHSDWLEARHELSEASKAVHFWNAMPTDLRTRMSMEQYREKRAEARRRFKLADELCRQASAANRADRRRVEALAWGGC